MSNSTEDNYLKNELYNLIKVDETIFDFIQESSLDGLWYWDLENPENEWMSPKFWTFFGYNPEEMQHKASAWQLIVNPVDLKIALENIEIHCKNPSHPYDQNIRYTHKNGSIVWIRCRGIAIRDDNGKTIRMLGAHHDITDFVQASESEEKFKAVVENGPALTTITNSKGYVEFASKQCENVIGWPVTEIIGLTMPDFIHPDDKAMVVAEWDKAINMIPIMEFEYRIFDKQNNIRWISHSTSTIHINNSFSILSTITNITERKKIEQELIASKEKAEENEVKFKALFENMNNSASHYEVIYDKNGIPCDYRFLDINAFYEKSIGIKASDFIGKTLLEVFPNTEKLWLDTFKNVVITSKPTIIESYAKEVNMYFELIVYVPQKGKLALIGSDVTARKHNELELIKAKERAEESDRLKTSFLQNMSHEIRTPMNAIMGFSSLLPDNFDDKEKLEDFSTIINQRCNDLLEIINDVLDISKIESGQSTLIFVEFNLNTLCSELALFFHDYQIRTNKQHIELILHPLPNETQAIVKTEKVKLKQILINLISNAFKFTEKGTIQCGCEIIDNKLRFYVSDTGVGIPKHKYDYIFERFAQLNNSTIKNIGGTGLGLPIVKGLVGLLGGEVWLESNEDKGTTFFFTIDYIPCVEPPKSVDCKQENIIDISRTNVILIVEDDVFNAMYLNEILQNHVVNIFTVNNGTDAIEFVKNNRVDIVLMDVRLPDMTGYEVTKAILKLNPLIKVIAQTAYATQDEQYKAISNGCVDYISKPTKQEQLLSVLRKYLE